MQVESKHAMEEKGISQTTPPDHSAHMHPGPDKPEPKHDGHGDHQHQ